MGNNQFGYARMYMDANELEKYVSSRLDERHEDKPIKLTDVEFNKFDGSVDFHFITLVEDDSYKPSGVWNHWDCDRVKINIADIINCPNKESLKNLSEALNKSILNGDFEKVRMITDCIRRLKDVLKY